MEPAPEKTELSRWADYLTLRAHESCLENESMLLGLAQLSAWPWPIHYQTTRFQFTNFTLLQRAAVALFISPLFFALLKLFFLFQIILLLF
jgi:hypothetical protein